MDIWKMSRKRIIVTCTAGFVFGMIIYVAGLIFVGIGYTAGEFVWIALNYTLLGFVIGISALTIPWQAHGPLIGATVGLLFPLRLLLNGAGPALFLLAFIYSCVAGWLIEYLATVRLHLPAARIKTRKAQAARE